MEEHAVRGVPWTLLSYAAARGLMLLAMIPLARLLEPADFGIVALGMLVIALARLLSDLGLGSTMLYRPDLDRSQLRTLLTLMVASGVAASLVLVAVAPLLAIALREPRLTWVLVALAGVLLLNGVIWFHESLIVRELAFKRRFVTQLAQSGVYAIGAPLLALAGAGVWSLVFGQLAAAVTSAVVASALAPFRVRPGLDRAVARDLFGVSAGFMSLGVVTFIRQNVDYLVVGRTLGASSLGYYSMAYRLTELPSSAVAEPVARVTFPAFSRMRTRNEDVASAFVPVLRLVALVTVPMGVLLSATSDPFTRTVFGEEWAPMVPALTALGIWGAVRPTWTTLGWYLNSVGEAAVLARYTAVSLVLLTAAAAVAATVGTITTVAWVVTTEIVLLTVVYARRADRAAGVPLRQQLGALLPAWSAGALCWLAARATVTALDGEGTAVALVGGIAAGSLVFVGTLLLVAPDVVRQAIRQVGRTLGRDSDVTTDSAT